MATTTAKATKTTKKVAPKTTTTSTKKSTTTKQATPKVAKTKTASKAKTVKHSPEQIHAMIAERAYYIAEKQNFALGMELHNWVEAERQINQELA